LQKPAEDEEEEEEEAGARWKTAINSKDATCDRDKENSRAGDKRWTFLNPGKRVMLDAAAKSRAAGAHHTLTHCCAR
jgi:hypothetical protein